MPPKLPVITFIRRGHSRSGGAEAYLKRLASGIVATGREARLVTTSDWPASEWTFGKIERVRSEAPRAFADAVAELEKLGDAGPTMSLERLWKCDVYRAGDGVHTAWLERRAQHAGPVRNFLRRFRQKHDDIVDLEASLLGRGGAKKVIVNSAMVKDEIVRIYGYPASQIELVRNGIPTSDFAHARQQRAVERSSLKLREDDFAILFVGSGWERKGLRFATAAVEKFGGKGRLLVAGRGPEARFRSSRTEFLGVRDTSALYAAADVFLLPTIHDPFSNACLEALASGLPVVTTAANGFSEIIQPGVHGTTVDDPADTATLCAALRYWSDRERRETAVPANVLLASNFDIAANVRRTLEIVLQTDDNAAST